MNRRQLLIGTAATAAVVACPITVAAAPDDAVLKSVLKFIGPDKDGTRYYGCNDDLFYMDTEINTKLISRNPDLFPCERHLFNGCPGNLFWNGKDTLPECVRSKYYESGYLSLEHAHDLKCVGRGSYEKYIDEIVYCMAAEFSGWQEGLRRRNKHTFSLIPAIGTKGIDPNTFQPYIHFRARFSILPLDYRIMTAEEDQQRQRDQMRSLGFL